ncbi:pyrimidine-nucleoside phosphorylase [Breznakia blatticola]|uniref:Pyrimidine-nucleoside phosphorylase n=1 Tax=Breznakia blatticola TaxID=1754012 RepID=A0A4R8A4L4_9FIRM|nr:thymidine phosphorylase [Breznakia blatticola]TDW25542.1 pyrimidine-nucleoside phosphorylase [Breznakia blatticola]
MNIVEIIEKKRDRHELSSQEIAYFVESYAKEEIAEYQASALLMAIYLRGMSDRELSDLTKDMIATGKVYDFSDLEGIFVDKHSTGGVGDKTSLVLAPVLAVCGLKVAKMSGRGLSFTGGTLDKLESIPGFQVAISEEDFKKQVSEIGCAIIGQSNDMVYADKKMYALRDVTGTVSSIPLIASSIMSKKLAAGSDVILLDVKCGDGAFMKDVESATELAKRMIQIGKDAGKVVNAEITSMNDVLGSMVGNSLEVLEAIETLQGKVHNDFYELCVHSAVTLLQSSGICTDEKAAHDMVVKTLNDGSALAKFKEMVASQHGDTSVVDDPSKLTISDKTIEVLADTSGYISKIHVEGIGLLGCALGAGRMRIEDAIDHSVGIEVYKKHGDAIEAGEALCKLYYNEVFDESFVKQAKDCFTISKEPVEVEPLIYTVL